ncbi:hypothetical protein [uncultured Aquimarina sp.]|uniref:hypothetical protein n=1 Tax=uncultured Aquimarina sp. TaxID=575652 RepID=UPI00261B380A|nr:hypothetical protein [uncultured Aquimarina sp.]
MGNKKKWTDNADQNVIELLTKISSIIIPLFNKNGIIELSKLDRKSDLEYLTALLLNSKFMSAENKNERNFGADDVIILKLEIEKNKFLKYWGKINWLSKPNDHECYKSYQDPFYGLFKIDNDQIVFVEAMFGDYDRNDLDGQYWIESDMNWMYEL